ncbi:MAG: hypothetical protein WC314_07505 [Vulcanimicrobiota bacterium]
MNTELDLTALKGLTMPIIAPSKIPQDLAIQKVEARPDPPHGDAYEIEWSSENAQLRLKASSTYQGKLRDRANLIEFDHHYFGECFLERTGQRVVTDWFTEMQAGYPAYSVEARGLDPEEVIEFVRSLDYVRIN